MVYVESCFTDNEKLVRYLGSSKQGKNDRAPAGNVSKVAPCLKHSQITEAIDFFSKLQQY